MFCRFKNKYYLCVVIKNTDLLNTNTMTLKNIYGSSVEVIGKCLITMKNGKEKWMFVVTGFTARGGKPVKYDEPEMRSVSDFSNYKKYIEILPTI